MNKRNFQLEMDRVLKDLEEEGRKPELLLHACCAPCSSYVLEYLKTHFKIRLFYYDPNIEPADEYEKRLAEARRLVREMNRDLPGEDIELLEGAYEPERFHEAVRGLENEPEGGRRCEACFRLRLGEAVKAAQSLGADYVTTTLSISPLKNAELLNRVGEEAAEGLACGWLPSDFKKRGGYQRSIELSARYGLYRQDYCGCVYSHMEREAQKARKAAEQASAAAG